RPGHGRLTCEQPAPCRAAGSARVGAGGTGLIRPGRLLRVAFPGSGTLRFGSVSRSVSSGGPRSVPGGARLGGLCRGIGCRGTLVVAPGPDVTGRRNPAVGGPVQPAQPTHRVHGPLPIHRLYRQHRVVLVLGQLEPWERSAVRETHGPDLPPVEPTA